MNFKIKNSLISFSVHENTLRETITFQVMPEGRNRISIANNYVYGNQYPSKDREQVSGRFAIEKLNNLNADSYSLDENKIGKVFFYEASVDEFGSYSIPPLIYFRVFLKDRQFDEIKQALLHGLPVANVSCGLEGLEFSWEPDGSHQEWKLKEDEEITKFRLPLQDVFITDFYIGFGKHFDDEYIEGRDQTEEKQIIEKKFEIKPWIEKYGWYAIIMALIIIYLVSK